MIKVGMPMQYFFGDGADHAGPFSATVTKIHPDGTVNLFCPQLRDNQLVFLQSIQVSPSTVPTTGYCIPLP